MTDDVNSGLKQFLKDMQPFFHGRSLTYVDVGAYVGQVCEEVLNSGLKIREVHLFEPNRDSLELAKAASSKLFKGASLSCHNLALGAHACRVTLKAAKSMTKVVAPSGVVDRDVIFEADCTTLDSLSSLFTERHISLLKVDVEGCEADVLAGAAELLGEQRVDVIYIEAGMNPEGQQHCYYRQLEDILRASHYRLFRIYEQQHEWISDSPFLRRVNLAFMSERFATSNPYKVSTELFQAKSLLTETKEQLKNDQQLRSSLEKKSTQQDASLQALEATLKKKEECIGTLDANVENLKSKLAATSQSVEKVRSESAAKIGTLEAEIRVITSELEQARASLQAAEKRSSATDSNLDALKKKSSQQDASLQALEATLKKREEYIETLHANVEGLKAKLAATGQCVEKVRSESAAKIGTLEAEIRVITSELEQARASLQAAEKRSSATDSNLDAMKKKSSQQDASLQALEATLKKREEYIETLHENVEGLKAKLAATGQCVEQVRAESAAKIGTLEAEIRDITSELEQARTVVQATEKRAAATDNNLASLRKKNAQQDASLQALETTLKEREECIETLHANVETLKSKLAASGQCVEQVRAESAAKIGTLEAEIRDITSELEQARTVLQATEKRAAATDNNLASLRKKNAQQEASLQALETTLKEREECIDTLHANVETLKLKLAASGQCVEKVRVESAAKIGTLEAEIRDITGELEQARTALQATEKRAAATERNLASLGKKNSQQCASLEALEATLEKREEYIETLDASVETLKSKLAATGQCVEKVRVESAAKIGTLEAEIRDITGELEQARTALLATQKKAAATDDSLALATSRQSELERELSRVMSEAEKARDVAYLTQTTLEKELAVAEVRRNAAEATVERMKLRVTELDGELLAARDRLEGTISDAAKKNDRIEVLEGQLSTREAALKKEVERSSSLGKNVSSLKDSLASVRKECEAGKGSLLKLSANVAALEHRVRALQRDAVRLEQEKNALITASQAKANDLKHRLSVTRARASNRAKLLARRTEQVNSLETSLTEARQLISELVNGVEAVAASNRWKIGNSLGRAADKLLFREARADIIERMRTFAATSRIVAGDTATDAALSCDESEDELSAFGTDVVRGEAMPMARLAAANVRQSTRIDPPDQAKARQLFDSSDNVSVVRTQTDSSFGVNVASAASVGSGASVAVSNVIEFSHDNVEEFSLSYEAKTKPVPERPPELPADLVLPPLRGVANDYSFVESACDERWADGRRDYTLAVSIVIPVYNRSRELDFVLAGLLHQTYPRRLMEIVIADDGSQEDLALVYRKYQDRLCIRYCRQDDLGYRLAEARNLGIATATHDSIIILDSDAIPSAGLVEEYMRRFHVERNIAMFGLRHYVSVDGIEAAAFVKRAQLVYDAQRVRSENDVATKADGQGHSTDWREQPIRDTDLLKREALPYRFLVGANCGFSREVFDKVGGYCDEFRAWGFEDQEFGYRLYREGTYFVPLVDAYVYHQEPISGKNDTDRKLGRAVTHDIFVQKCPFIYRKRSKIEGPFEVPLVSIYVPLYNRERHIIECIRSALAQTVQDLEVVICDDGSTDRSVALIEKHFGHDRRVRLIKQANGGIGAASNTAVRASRGFYIGQLDADDVLKRDAVEQCLKVMERDPELALVYGTTEYIDENSKVTQEGWNWPRFTREYLITRMICHHFRFFRKRDWARTTGFNEGIRNAVDYDMMLKLAEVGEVEHLNRVLYQYRKHAATTTAQENGTQTVNNFIVINDSLRRMGITNYSAVPDESKQLARSVKFVGEK